MVLYPDAEQVAFDSRQPLIDTVKALVHSDQAVPNLIDFTTNALNFLSNALHITAKLAHIGPNAGVPSENHRAERAERQDKRADHRGGLDFSVHLSFLFHRDFTISVLFQQLRVVSWGSGNEIALMESSENGQQQRGVKIPLI